MRNKQTKITVFLKSEEVRTPQMPWRQDTEKSSKMEGFSVGNSKYTLHPSSTDEGKSFPQNNYKINTIMHFSTPHFLLMHLRLGLGKKTLILKDGLRSSKQKASCNSSKSENSLQVPHPAENYSC